MTSRGFTQNGDDPPSFDRTPTISRRLQGGRQGAPPGTDPSSFDRSKTMGASRKVRPGEEGSGGGSSGSSRKSKGDSGSLTRSGTMGGVPKAQFNRVNSMIQHSIQEEGTGGEDQPRFNRTLSMTGKMVKKKSAARQPVPDEVEQEEAGGSGGGVEDMEQAFGRSMTLGSKPRFKSSGPSSNQAAQGQPQQPSGTNRSMTLSDRKQSPAQRLAQDPAARSRSPLPGGAQSPAPALKPALKKTSSVSSSPSQPRARAPSDPMSYGDRALSPFARPPDGQQGYPPGANGMEGQYMDYGQPGMQQGMQAGFYQGEYPGQNGPVMHQPASSGDSDSVVLPMLPPPGAPQVVQCQKCGQLLEVPTVLPPAKKGVQKLRCGKCLRVSRFQINPADPRSAASIAAGGGYPEEETLGAEDGTPRMMHSGSTGGVPPHMYAGEMDPNRPGSGQQMLRSPMGAGGVPPPMGGVPHQYGGGGGMQEQGMEGGYYSGSGVEDAHYRQDMGYGGGAGMVPMRAHPGGGGMPPHMVQGPPGGMPPQGARMGGYPVQGMDGGEGGPVMGDRPTFSRRVVVNGEPVRDDFVQVAEQRAGPIHPGNYWYDVIAGFWGEMGGPCLGIVPPGIEFGVPLPRNCAGGSTRVLVNGRELHHKDLERLMKRGLPNGQDRAYRVEINGNVFDWDSGEFLMALGKLAPSLETRKRGGGMKMPEGS